MSSAGHSPASAVRFLAGRALRATVAAVGRRYRLTAVLLPLVFVPVVAVGGLGAHAWRARTHLEHAAALAKDLERAVVSARFTDARALVAALRRETASAGDELDGIGWRGATHLPGLGDDLAAVAEVVTALRTVADALPEIIAIAERVSSATGAAGPVTALTDPVTAGPALGRAETAVRRARDRIAAVDVGSLVPQLREPVRAVRRELDRAARLLSIGTSLVQVLPAMLGAPRPRTWLVLFQNPAELRATGGMAGAWMMVRSDRGALSIVDQGTASMTRAFDAPVLPLDPELRALYGDRLGRYTANVNLTPDFPTAAALAAEMYRRRSGHRADGVIALDPVGLSYLLRATGPVTFRAGAGAAGQLSSGNAVRLLLADAYARMDSPAAKNDYFAEAARAVFDTVAGGRLDARAALSAVLQMVQERRLLVWSARPDEQRLIERLPVAGRLPLRDPGAPIVGIFLNDGSGAKLNYYLRSAATLTFVRCPAQRRRMLRVEATFTSRVPPSGLPPYVLGLGLAGDPYTMRLNVSLFAPTGGGLVEARLDGRRIPVGSGYERERQVSMATLDIAPGASRTLVALLDIGATAGTNPAELTPQLWTTPTVTGWTLHTTSTTGTGPTPVTSTC